MAIPKKHSLKTDHEALMSIFATNSVSQENCGMAGNTPVTGDGWDGLAGSL